ncbi:MAG TPA: DUF4340 domain-containing protein [Verrucomicrobiae bacterium]|nr:DUF4340 domain-containing protein [Verrucomicrobiae bacterium]
MTWVLVSAAAALFLFIIFVERKIPGTAERKEAPKLLAGAAVNAIDSIQVAYSAGGLVRAEKTNGNWFLTHPFYPARQTAIETFATNLVELRKLDRLPAHEVVLQGQKSFGFDPPRATVEVEFETNTVRFEIGANAPLTNNVYLRFPSSGEVVLVDGTLLGSIPRSTNDWRSLELAPLSEISFDHLQVRAGQRLLELGRTPTNNLWQITRPVPARADQNRVLDLLELLRGAEVSDFVTDAPAAELERFGLQVPEVELSFIAGTNRLYTIEFGNSPTNHTNQVYARLLGQTNVVLAPRSVADYLKQPYRIFHDPRLLTMNPRSLDRITARSTENFVLQRQPDGTWINDNNTKMPVDRELLARAIGVIASMQILDIVKEVPTESDLKAVGLLPPIASYSFFEKVTNAVGIVTNVLFMEIQFGGAQADKIYARRSDENPIYLTQLALMLELPKRAFELRERKIWRFNSTNLVSISLSNGKETNTVKRAPQGWSPDPITNAAIEEIAFRLSQLDAQSWVAKGRERLATFGFRDDSITMRLETRGTPAPEPLGLRFGRLTLRRDIYAAIVLPGDTEPTVFEFPGDLYNMMLQSLPFPK